MLGLGPQTIVLVLGVAIVVFPLALLWMASRRRKATRGAKLKILIAHAQIGSFPAKRSLRTHRSRYETGSRCLAIPFDSMSLLIHLTRKQDDE